MQRGHSHVSFESVLPMTPASHRPGRRAAAAGVAGRRSLADAATPSPLVAVERQPASGRASELRGPLRLALRAGRRHTGGPRAMHGPALQIEAFGEADRPPAGARAAHSRPRGDRDRRQHSQRSRRPLRVHGLCARDGTPCVPLERRRRRDAARSASRAALPGTYHYWATTTGMPLVVSRVDRYAAVRRASSSIPRRARRTAIACSSSPSGPA